MTYSLDFREKVLRVKENESLSFVAVAKRFDVGLASVVRWSTHIVSKKTREKPATKSKWKLFKKTSLTIQMRINMNEQKD